ncbi:MAG TPA: hypothetical protein G4O08_13470 [Anaerolineae bacterium]|nr:hypothetical protein [Anaerolineae bacterium]
MINLKRITLFVLLILMLGTSACGESISSSITDVGTEPSLTTSTMQTLGTATPTTRPGYYSREQLIEDARQLATILEDTHPDPYIRGGGKIAFHRRLQQLVNAIPAEGMTKEEFVRLLRPFIAAVGDAHTVIWDAYRVNDSYPGGVPLRFDIVEESLYVSGVPDEDDVDLIGALLVSVEGVPLAELRERQERLQGTENQYQILQLLAVQSLWYGPYMQDLLPEWRDPHEVRVELRLPSGEIEELSFALPVVMTRLHEPESQIHLTPSSTSGFPYDFVDDERKTAYLRILQMSHYREAYELWALSGSQPTTEQARARIPSATEIFRELVVEMKEAQTETLIIDLRENQGGLSLMSDILLYYLYDREDFLAVKTYSPVAGGGEIRRISELLLNNCTNLSIEDYNEGRAVPLIVGDYNFDDDFTDDVDKVEQLFQQSDIPAFLERWLNRSSTFYAEFESGAYAGYYRPQSILVLVSPETFSSGFTMARHFYLAGATLVGTPSGQSSNCFGETIRWILGNTHLEGTVSGSYFNTFPNDPELGRYLPMHYPLTYEILASYGFDPNATYLYALAMLSGGGE